MRPLCASIRAALLVVSMLAATIATAADVQPITAWTTGTTGPSRFTAGNDRLLVFTAGVQNNGNRFIQSITFGGQPMTEVVTDVMTSNPRLRAYIFILDEAGIQSANSNTFSVSWNGGTSNVHYAARMYANVDQASPIRDFASNSSNSSSPNPITTPAMDVIDGDYAVAAALCGNTQQYSWNNGFQEGTDVAGSSSRFSTADRAVASDGVLAASATNNNPNRQVIVAAVLQGVHVDLPETFYVRPDGNNSNDGDGPAAGQAWQTIHYALNHSSVGPGDTIHVMTGDYNEQITPAVAGTVGNPIRIIADTSGAVFGSSGAVVVAAPHNQRALNIENDDYLEFTAFTFVGANQIVVEIDDSIGVVLDRCIIRNGANGLELQDTASALITNCLIYNNGGHGVYTVDHGVTLEIYHCVIAHNGEDGLKQRRGTVIAKNNIFAYNGQDGYDHDNGARTTQYNLAFGNDDDAFSGFSADGTNLTSDPKFVDPAGRDYQLQAASPAVNAATVINGIETDFNGYQRVLGGGPDIGAYEYPFIGWWKLNEAGGLVAADSSGEGNDGSLHGSFDWQENCGGDTASLKFNGATDYVQIDDPVSGLFDRTEAFTLMAFIKVDSTANRYMRVVSKKSAWDQPGGYEIEYNPALTRLTLGLKDQQQLIATGVDLNDGWHHVAATFAPVGGGRYEAKLYVDGTQLATNVTPYASLGGVSPDGYFDSLAENNEPLVIGRNASSSGVDYFQGEIRDVRLYGAPLSAAEIAAVNGLILHWKLDESSGSVAVDASGNNYDGLVSGTPNWTSNGKLNGAFNFQGSQTITSYAVADALNGLQAVTICMWVKSNLTDVDRGLYFTNAPNGNDELLGMRYDRDGWSGGGRDLIKYSLTTTAGTQQGESANYTQTIAWQHLAFVWSSGGTLTLYINGELDTPTAAAHPLAGSISGIDRFTLGIGTKNQEWEGLIDDVRIYGRALCGEELTGLSGSGHGKIRIKRWVEVQ